jgi:hypothetical protein
MKIERLWGVALAAALAVGGSAQASTLIGTTVDVSVTGNASVVGPSSRTVGALPEFTVNLGLSTFVIDLGANSARFEVGGGAALLLEARSITLTNLLFTGPAADITSIGVLNAGLAVSSASLAFTANSLTLTINQSLPLAVTPGDFFLVTFLTTPRDTTAVPLPGGMALLMPALLGLGLLRRRA